MRILFCCEFYAPAVGGVPEVMRQLAERLAAKGHEVTVATSQLVNRDFNSLNGVCIQEFEVSGNLVKGMFGDKVKYRKYILNGDFDVVMIKAAQQWTFDALWPILEKIKIPKVFIPCGFSGLMEPAYADYFAKMPEILGKFDHLIFYASDYRDINFAKQFGLTKFSIIPNGASEFDFNIPTDGMFRSRNDISPDDFVFLTVGSFTGLKGHLELARAFEQMNVPDGKNTVLILNGNESSKSQGWDFLSPLKLVNLIRTYGIYYSMRHVMKTLLLSMRIVDKTKVVRGIAANINRVENNKKVLITNFPKSELIQAYVASDLFVFASNVEYSPLVLFESAAAGIPFLSVDVGNAVEISKWTESGKICPSERDSRGYTRVDPAVLAEQMNDMMCHQVELREMGEKGRRNWSDRFTWKKISEQYEKVFENLIEKNNVSGIDNSVKKESSQN